MLTAAQCRTVAYQVEGEIVCTSCVENNEDCTANELIDYSANELAGDDGLSCDRCGKEIIEPAPRCEDCDELEDDCSCDDEDEDEETEEDDTEAEASTPCPTCGGPGLLLGALGNRAHFRCRNCGIEFNKENNR